MTDISTIAGGRPPTNQLAANTYNPIVATSTRGNFPRGTVVCPSGSLAGGVVPANASVSHLSPNATGLAVDAGVVGNRVLAQFSGVFTMTAEEWDAITGDTGGLAENTVYFLAASFPNSAGRITSTPPSTSGDAVLRIGVGLSPTDLLIQIGEPTIVP